MKLLVTDYDNTYELHYDNMDLDKIFKRNQKALEIFRQNNIVAVATGRHFDAIKHTIDEKKIKFDYLCCNNGAEMYDNNYNILFTLPINELSLNIIQKLEKIIKIHYRHPFCSNEITSINIYFDELEKFENVKKYLNDNLNNCYIEYKYPKIKILNKDCNKVKFVDLLVSKLLLNVNDVYTIGDDINDINMIKKYNGYSLNTAINEVKQISKKNYNTLSEFVGLMMDDEKN